VDGVAGPLRQAVLPDLALTGPSPLAAAEADSAADKIAEMGQLGDFRLIREVGRGGMGVVYEAEQISCNRRVALKVLPFAAAMNARHLRRFKNEAMAAACLQHQNIVPVYFVGVKRSIHFYAMQFVDGPTLAEVIAGLKSEPRTSVSGPLEPPLTDVRGSDQTVAIAALSTLRSTKPATFYRAVAEGIQAAEALEYAHQMGIVHRRVAFAATWPSW
jgi:serine/threonine protein kinase